MPINVQDLLKPVSEDKPSGADLRYAPVTDEIREARRSEDEAAQGVWKREVKAADYARVITLAKDVLTKKSKDLQIAGWLTEALLVREGFKGLQQGLELIQGLLENFWETVWPAIDEDGDLEMRATPLRWVGSQLTVLVRSVPVTQTGINWLRYKESRGVPTEEEANANTDKGDARREAVEDGRLTPEEWNEAVNGSSLGFYQKLYEDAQQTTEMLAKLSSFCDERFPDDPPDFGPLRSALEDVGQTARILLIGKGGRPGGEAEPEEAPAEESGYDSYAEPAAMDAGGGAAAAPRMARAPRAGGGMEPADEQDAVQRIVAAAHFLRKANPANSVPYLVLRALRWGEIRNAGIYADPSLADSAPPTQVRVDLKRLFGEMEWNTAIDTAETAMAQPCGRTWLDLQRYVVRACRNMGNVNVATAIVAELKALLADYPLLPKWSMADDTPAANAETLEWLQEEKIVDDGSSQQAAGGDTPAPQPVMYDYSQAAAEPAAAENGDGAHEAGPDAMQLALDAARSGRVDEALEIMSREIHQAASGRGRFLRRAQLAQICLAAGKMSIAAPVLKELAAEIEQRRLEDWEAADIVAQPLSLLYRCLESLGDDEARKAVYERVCRLDPVRALGLGG